ncbi:hypothetical protein ABZP36_032958, partial [Zizania latifolia]
MKWYTSGIRRSEPVLGTKRESEESRSTYAVGEPCGKFVGARTAEGPSSSLSMSSVTVLSVDSEGIGIGSYNLMALTGAFLSSASPLPALLLPPHWCIDVAAASLPFSSLLPGLFLFAALFLFAVASLLSSVFPSNISPHLLPYQIRSLLQRILLTGTGSIVLCSIVTSCKLDWLRSWDNASYGTVLPSSSINFVSWYTFFIGWPQLIVVYSHRRTRIRLSCLWCCPCKLSRRPQLLTLFNLKPYHKMHM